MMHVKVTHQIKVRVSVPGRLAEPPPKPDLIAEYISHAGENERFSVTGSPGAARSRGQA